MGVEGLITKGKNHGHGQQCGDCEGLWIEMEEDIRGIYGNKNTIKNYKGGYPEGP